MARKHIAWYSAGLEGSARFRAAVNAVAGVTAMRRLIDDFYAARIERAAA